MSGTGVRLGLLGTGAAAQVMHLPILSQMQGVNVEAVCDRDRSKASAIASRFAVPRVLDSDEDVIGADVDGVIICTPSHLHEEQAVAALDAGKHVLVEKPLALTAAGVERVLRAAERAGRTVQVALHNRNRPDILALRPFIQGRELGEIFLVKAVWLNRKVRPQRPTWRSRQETAGGGALMDLGVQVLDLCMWLLGSPRIDRLVAQVHTEENAEVEDAAALMLMGEGGLVIAMQLTWSLVGPRDHNTLQVLGTHGSASLPPLMVNKEVEHGMIDVTPQFAVGRENLYMASYRRDLWHFVSEIRGEMQFGLPWDQVELMRLLALAYESAREGKEVRV
jgi:predicted dehydrogenase